MKSLPVLSNLFIDWLKKFLTVVLFVIIFANKAFTQDNKNSIQVGGTISGPNIVSCFEMNMYSVPPTSVTKVGHSTTWYTQGNGVVMFAGNDMALIKLWGNCNLFAYRHYTESVQDEAYSMSVNVIKAKPTITIAGNEKTDDSIILSAPKMYLTLKDTTKAELETKPISGYLWSTGEKTQSIIVRRCGSYTVTITDPRTCMETSDPVNITFNSNVMPVISKIGEADCMIDTVILSAAPGYTSYRWSTGDTTQSISVHSSGGFKVTVKDINDCMGISELTVLSFPTTQTRPQITQRADTLFSTKGLGYQWKRNSKVIPNETKQFIVIHDLENYIVTVTDEKSCTASSDVYLVKALDVDEQALINTIHIYPNPTNGDIQIDVPFGETECRVSNVLGLTVAKYILPPGKTTVSLSDFPGGIYSVELTSGNQRFVQVITKQ